MTDYIAKIQVNGESKTIGGYNFDSYRSSKTTYIAAAATYAAQATKTFDLSSLLPDDGYDYECYFSGYANTGATSGNSVSLLLYRGSSASGLYTNIARSITRAAVAQTCGGFGCLPILASNKKVTYYNSDGSGTSGNVRIYLSSYRRLGKNGTESNYIGNAQVDNTTIPIGGNNFNGSFTYVANTLGSNVTLQASSGNTVTYSLASILPNDGCAYDVLITTQVNATTTTAGKYATIRAYSGSDSSSQKMFTIMSEIKNTTTSIMFDRHSAIIQIRPGDRNISFYNTGSSVAACYFYVRGYRRQGNNDTTTSTNYLQNIQVGTDIIPVGGNNFDGQWVYKIMGLFDAKTYSTSGTLETYSLDDYLPNDGYDYEILVTGYCRTGTTSGNNVTLSVRNWNSTANFYLCNANTRSASSTISAGSINCWVPSSNRNIKIYVILSGTTGNCKVNVMGYRRLGKNT